MAIQGTHDIYATSMLGYDYGCVMTLLLYDFTVLGYDWSHTEYMTFMTGDHDFTSLIVWE